MKNQKGITLVALVVTIIVLLILAGVSLALVTGENGILGKASDTAKTQKEAEMKENVSLQLVALEANYYELKYQAGSTVTETSAAAYAINHIEDAKTELASSGVSSLTNGTDGTVASFSFNNGKDGSQTYYITVGSDNKFNIDTTNPNP